MLALLLLDAHRRRGIVGEGLLDKIPVVRNNLIFTPVQDRRI